MRKTVSVFPILALLACMVCAFLWTSAQSSQSIDELNQQCEVARLSLTDAQSENQQLQQTLQLVGTDAFIENQARTMYGYMKPDEIRLVIVNPEALYGDETLTTP